MAALPTGLPAIADVAKSDVIVLVGFDPSEATPVLDLHIKRAVRRKSAKLVIVNPRRIEAARYVDDPRVSGSVYIPVRPGDEALALSELAALLQTKKAAAPKLEAGAKGPRPQAGPAQPAGTLAMTRASRPDIAAAADALLGAKAPLFIYGPDAARGERGRLALTALSNLAVVLGAGDRLAYVGHEANGQGLRDMGVVANSLPGHLPVGDAGVRDRLGKLWGVQPPAEPGLTYQQMLDGGVRGLFLMEADPAASATGAEALRKLDFLVVQDLFLTETARLAHVVLPATTWAETNGTYTNLERRVQRAPDGIDSIQNCLPGWAIMTLLAERWMAVQSTAQTAHASSDGIPDWKRKKRARTAAKGASAPKAWTYQTPQAVLEEIAKAVPVYAALRWENLTDQGVQWPASGLVRPPRRFEPLDAQPLPAAPAGQFALVSGPQLWDGGVLMQHAAAQVRNRLPAPFVGLNPADLAAGRFADGHPVTVTSAGGAVTLAICAHPSVQPGTAWVPYGLTGLPAETLGAGRGEPVSVTIAPAAPAAAGAASAGATVNHAPAATKAQE